MATLTCAECNYANEGERIYCHNCGAKLDRTLLPKTQKQSLTREEEQRRVRRAVNPSRGFLAGAGKTLFATLFWAAFVACVIQMVRPPDRIPPFLTREQLFDAQPLGLAIEDALQKPAPQLLAFRTDDINKYLAYTIKTKANETSSVLEFKRAFVQCDAGNLRITREQSVSGYPLFASTFHRLEVQKNQLAAPNVGGAIGRMPIHPQIMAYGDLIFQPLWDALRRERKLLDQMQAVEVQKDRIVLTSKPAAR